MSLPAGALHQHLAILGRTGSGKTYAAKGIVEDLLRAGRRVCVLDPTGAWWGLRGSADGKSPGFPVVVFGGDHADVPITEHAGAALGELIAGHNVPAVIDLSGTTLGERHRFVERFAESLFRANRLPLHLIIDEADEFAPQSGPPGTERMLGAIDRLVRRGRIKGFRVTMISQRPAVLNKNVLTQASTLIAMRLPAPQDRKAVEDWIKGQADVEKGRQVLESLSRLQRGEGWIWSPEHGVLERVTFGRITTFDSSRTPEDGEEIAGPARLADVDLSAVTAAMAAAIERAEANDPGVLRKQVDELKRQLADARHDARQVDESEIEYRGVLRACREMRQVMAPPVGELRAFVAEIVRAGGAAQRAADLLASALGAPLAAPLGSPPADPSRNGTMEKASPDGRPTRVVSPPHVPDGLGASHGRILDAIAWWKSAGVGVPTRAQVAAVSGYTVNGGTFCRYLSALSSAGLIRYPDPGSVDLTPIGAGHAPTPSGATSLAELHDRVRGVLEAPHRRILDVLLAAGGAELGRTAVAEQAGYEASGGSFNRYVSHLSSLRLIRYPKRTTVAVAAWLFPEGLR